MFRRDSAFALPHIHHAPPGVDQRNMSVPFQRLARNTRSLTILAIAAGLLFPATAATGKNVVVSSPFEVGASPAGNYLAALVAGADTDTLAAATFFREALRYDPRNKELIERTFIASLTNANMPDSFALAQRLLKYDRKNGLAHLALAAKAFKAKQWSAARKEISAGGAASRDITVLLLGAWSYAGAGNTQRALETLDQLKEERFVAFRDYHAGLMADLAGNIPEATKRFKSAYEGEHNSLRVVDAWGRFLTRRGDFDQARKVYEEFNKLVPRHPLVVAALKDIEARKALEPAVTSTVAGAGEVLYGLGASGGQSTDSLASMIYLRLGLYLAPENGLAIVTLADAYERLKQYERAIDVYNSMPQRSPLRANSDIQTGLILEAMTRSDDAMAHLKAIVAERPSDIEAVTALANLYRARKQWPEAAAAYTKVIDLIGTPAASDWTLFYSRGIANERSKQWPPAEADFKKALELKPDQPQVLNYLGYSWVDQGMNLDEAFRLLRKAVDQSRGDGYIIDSLGWAYFKLGRYDDARRELESAIDLKPGDPVINDHLGDVYWKVGRKLEAEFQWNHARDMKPEPDDLERILKKIKDGLPDDAPATKTEAAPVMAPAKDGG
jgi:tetratricopeptide (TPR) repeat protein